MVLLCNEVHCSCYASWTIPLETLVRCAATYKTKGFITLCIVAKKHEPRVPKNCNIGYFGTVFTMQSIIQTTWFPSVELDLSHPQPVLTWTFTFLVFHYYRWSYLTSYVVQLSYLSVLMTFDKKTMLRTMTRRTGIPRNQEWPSKSTHLFGYAPFRCYWDKFLYTCVYLKVLVHIKINSNIFLCA